ncbi:MAG: hydrogenase expression/formation protein HypE [Clostridia bacterium]
MDERIGLAHGAGGMAYRELVEELFLPAFRNDMLSPLTDSAVCAGAERIALTTDSYVISPLFFPGGDIGRLSVCGTVNDLAVSGAVPKYLTVGMILETGLETAVLARIVNSMAQAASEAGVAIVTGDTKVVERGCVDSIFINTAGVGIFSDDLPPLPQCPLPGDTIILTGCIASHGIAVMCARHKLVFTPPIQSDVAPLASLASCVRAAGSVSAMRDPTRGGVAATLCEWVCDNTDIELYEQSLRMCAGVSAACELLGLDPLHIANEGVMLISVPSAYANAVLRAVRSHPLGTQAEIIGRVLPGHGNVYATTAYGSKRRIFLPRGEILPRIC